MNSRAFSLESDFMSWHINDLFYCWLMKEAKYKKETNTLFIEYSDYLSKMECAKEAALCTNDSTLYRAMVKLLKSDLISIGNVNWYNKDRKAIILKNSFTGRYQIVKFDMLDYLVKTRSKGCVQIYVFLLNKYLWSATTNRPYDFTYSELATLLGYKNKKEGARSVKIMIESLWREGLIELAEVWLNNENSAFGKVRALRVTKIIQNVAELKPFNVPKISI